jgi:hypothetical protein
MMRLFVLVSLCLSFAVTGCNNGGKKRQSLRKNKAGVDAKASENSQKINKAIEDKKCLRVDKLVREIMKLKDETVVIYTSDLDLGLLSVTADPTFESQVDAKTRAHALLKNDREPILESLRASDLQTRSSIAFLLSISAIDDECKTAAFESTARATYEIFKKGPGALWMRNKADSADLILYQYDRKNKLTITHYTPNTAEYCGKQPRMLKRKYILAREDSTDKLELERGFAELIAANIEEPAEMTAALGKDSAGRMSAKVVLKYSVLRGVQQILQAETFQQPACTAP